jgi:hypothetical protein
LHIGRAFLVFFVLTIGSIAYSGWRHMHQRAEGKPIGDSAHIKSSTPDADHPPQDDVKLPIRCTTGSFYEMHADGTLTNHTAHAANYTVTAVFGDTRGDGLADGSAKVFDLAPGATRAFTVYTTTAAPQHGGWVCGVADIERNAAP